LLELLAEFAFTLELNEYYGFPFFLYLRKDLVCWMESIYVSVRFHLLPMSLSVILHSQLLYIASGIYGWVFGVCNLALRSRKNMPIWDNIKADCYHRTNNSKSPKILNISKILLLNKYPRDSERL
jgi:hypothetical protein